jgi:hypothetical protein
MSAASANDLRVPVTMSERVHAIVCVCAARAGLARAGVAR